MNKSEYQMLRYHVEAEIDLLGCDEASARNAVNSIMQAVLHRLVKEEVGRQHSKRKFLTFRRNPENIAPSWALHNPGISSRLPTL